MNKIMTTKVATEATAVTHTGLFHADEIFATVILSKVMGNVTVLRTFRVPEELDSSVIVYDIGNGKYDHHQKEGNGTRDNGVPYASAGLIWRDFGAEVVKDTCNPDLIWSIIDRDLIQGIDALDNGKMPTADYPTHPMTVSQIISGFYPNWDSTEDPDTAFLKAVDFAETIFDNVLANAVSKVNAQDIVDAAIEQAEGNIMVLDRFVPWQDFIFSSTHSRAEEVHFVIFPSNRGGFNWQCVPDAPGSFGQRKPVPAEWKGLRDGELQEVTGVETASFCHPAGFIGGADTLEDAIKLATLAVNA